jgi:hypothetical protein
MGVVIRFENWSALAGELGHHVESHDHFYPS